MTKQQPAKKVLARRLLEIGKIADQQTIVMVSVDFNRDPIILCLEGNPDYRHQDPSGVSFFKGTAKTANRFHIYHKVQDTLNQISLPPTNQNFTKIQALDDGSWLLVVGRADSQSDKNASIFDSSGSFTNSFYAGDGIQDVQVSKGNDIWVSYFDEGVFSDHIMSQSGIVCLDRNGNVIFDFAKIRDKEKLPVIDDCYAMNVVSDRETWLYYYSDFPVIKLTDKEVDHYWPSISVEGSAGFAASSATVLLGPTHEQKDRLFLLELSSKRVELIEPTDETGHSVTIGTVFGRGNKLYLWNKTSLYCVDMADIS